MEKQLGEKITELEAATKAGEDIASVNLKLETAQEKLESEQNKIRELTAQLSDKAWIWQSINSSARIRIGSCRS